MARLTKVDLQKRRIIEFFNRPIIDSKRTIPITVQKRDISGATRKECDACAFANAVAREMKPEDLLVFRTRVYVKPQKGEANHTKIIRFIVNPALQDQIHQFDSKGLFDTGTYSLTKPTDTKALGKRRGGHDKPGSRGRGRRRNSPVHLLDIRREAPRGRSMSTL